MAGDWIKVEHASVDKPEVLRIAEMLGVERRYAIGLLLDFWVWLDRNSRNANVTHMSRMSIDNFTHTPGFSAALIDVGWAEMDDATGKLTITNWDRHNGKSAKTRALGKERASRNRHANVTQDALPEKRREEIDTSLRSVSTARAKRGESAECQQPSDEHRAIALKTGVDVEVEFVKYKDWWLASGKKHKDQNAGFRNWLRNAKPGFAGKQPSLAERRADNVAVLTGQKRSIDGTAERVGGPAFPALPDDLREPRGDDVG